VIFFNCACQGIVMVNGIFNSARLRISHYGDIVNSVCAKLGKIRLLTFLILGIILTVDIF
jgi:hypothetical protein